MLPLRFEFPQYASQFKSTTGYEYITDNNIYRGVTQIESYWQQVSEDNERQRERVRESVQPVDALLI
jgi:hypothetical protein